MSHFVVAFEHEVRRSIPRDLLVVGSRTHLGSANLDARHFLYRYIFGGSGQVCLEFFWLGYHAFLFDIRVRPQDDVCSERFFALA